MKVSLNWLKQYIDIDLDPQKVGEILTEIGLEVEGIEEVESIKGGLEGVVVGEVVECGQHPNADRLSLTKVDIGTGEPLQVVCGASNVAKGQKVMLATVGTTLHPLGSEEPLTLKKGKIRGEVSEGMICAEDELGIGEDHAGILVLPETTPIGLSAREYFRIETDTVYEIGLTPNRSDATNHLGVARDLAAALQINYGYSGEVRIPEVEELTIGTKERPISVVVENEAACPRYSGVVIANIEIRESPDWLKKRLTSIGVRPINNIVDITNFILHELGQPLHAFDYDAIAGQQVIVKTLAEGSSFTTLDEVERKLSAEDLMICDGNEHGMCIGGVFGGIRSGVTEKTQTIFLESAHFHPEYIRRSSMRHNLRTDAAKVFEKGSDPNITLYALKRAAQLIAELGGGIIASPVIDRYPQPILPVEVSVTYQYVNRLIGIELAPEAIHRILAAMEMQVVRHDNKAFTVAVPTNKADVTRPADVVEEILRIYGFNKVPIPEQIRTAVTIGRHPDPSEVRNRISNLLTNNGFYEMMAVSLSRSNYYRDLLPSTSEEALVFINNTSNVHLDIMRPDMLFSGLEAIVHNQNRQQTNIKLYEFGKSYRYDGGRNIQEQSHLSLLLTGNRWEESWLNPRRQPSDFYTLKTYVTMVLERMGLNTYQESDLEDPAFSYGLKIHRGPNDLVDFGKVNPKLSQGMGIRGEVFYAVFAWDHLFQAARTNRISYEEVNKFPTTRRDLALVIDNSVKFNDIVAIARKLGKQLITNINLFDVYENEAQLGAGKRSYAVSFTLEDKTRTLEDKTVDKLMDKLIKEYESKLGAVIRR